MTKLTNEKIVKRLRIAARHNESQGRMMNEAANLIEQQQARIDELLFENSALHRELRKSRNGKDGE